jgi:hypothetical protein
MLSFTTPVEPSPKKDTTLENTSHNSSLLLATMLHSRLWKHFKSFHIFLLRHFPNSLSLPDGMAHMLAARAAAAFGRRHGSLWQSPPAPHPPHTPCLETVMDKTKHKE